MAELEQALLYIPSAVVAAVSLVCTFWEVGVVATVFTAGNADARRLLLLEWLLTFLRSIRSSRRTRAFWRQSGE
jgi:hypothetical protein